MPFREVFVLYEDSKLTILPEDFELKAADEIVVWKFINLPQHAMPEVVFEAQTNTDFTGPFSDLIGRRERVIGLGGEVQPELPTLYNYQVSIRRLGAESIRSPTLKVADRRQEIWTGTQVQVEWGQGGLSVTPERLTTFSGAPLNWDFQPALGKTPDTEKFRPRIFFTDPENALGPFPDLTCTASAVQGHLAPGGEGRQFRYAAELVPVQQENGTKILMRFGEDPILDDEGEPP